jgi:hypothetical protein
MSKAPVIKERRVMEGFMIKGLSRAARRAARTACPGNDRLDEQDNVVLLI